MSPPKSWTYSEMWQGRSIALWRITLLERIADGLVRLQLVDLSDRGTSEAVWSRGVSRKAAKCAVSGEKIEKGSVVYRPAGNLQYRSKRILADKIDSEGNDFHG